ncbi:carbohydrate ABC transporter permease [Paractinoplanes durhamensis]|uniref:Sugar ABC transporter ATP-binding protein n=1 Tax=Paractinoplanes durhamensis TaxID=113563 RepID=A0ABQ3Z347_9ACTN|nr:carbohydrate ABC transporter permease [Actinoplanes durhamensis]GIE04225.1 sugar ABC transporter ATP-binding protein [Actinoplanes durhamensis]
MTLLEVPVADTRLALDPPPARSRRGYRLLGYAALLVAAAAILVPFYWMLMSSLKSNNDVYTIPVQWLPDPVVWKNYVDIWQKSDLTTWLKNTLILSVAVTFLQVFTGSFAAYGFAKVRFPGRNVLFLAYIGTLAVPWQSYMIPQFILFSKLHLSDTLWSIIALQAFGAFGVFLMKQYYESIPDELLDAARIDGMSEYGIYRRIMLPLSVPALASLTLLTLVTTWNDYMGPLIYLRSRDLWTIQIGLKTFVNTYNAEYALIMTGSVLSVLPIAIIFLLGQRYFVEGIASTGLKG